VATNQTQENEEHTNQKARKLYKKSVRYNEHPISNPLTKTFFYVLHLHFIKVVLI